MANDDWRVQATVDSESLAEKLAERLKQGDVAHRLDAAAGQHVVVSVDDSDLFLYAGTREQANAASDALKELAASEGATPKLQIRRWHPVAEEWEDPDNPLPSNSAEIAQERAELDADEDRESEALGYAEWEVRIELPSHHATVEFSDKLTGEGFNNVRRWKYIVVGANDEDAARQLATRIQNEVPEGGKVSVEGSAPVAESEMPKNRFIWFGGLGG